MEFWREEGWSRRLHQPLSDVSSQQCILQSTILFTPTWVVPQSVCYGDGKGEGTHLTIFACLMRGDYDNNLQWPFEGDLVVDRLEEKTIITIVEAQFLK